MSSSNKKELRKTLGAYERVLMILMPTSQAAAWVGLGLAHMGHMPIDRLCLCLSVFYGIWSVRNRFFQSPAERGYYAFSTCALGCQLGLHSAAGRACAVLGALAVFGAFAFAAQSVLRWPLAKLAYVAKKTLTWALFMRVYYVSSLVFWPAAALSLGLA